MAIAKLLVVILFIFIATPAYSFPPTGKFELHGDQGSTFCLACHDGLRAGAKQMQHPVDLDYRLAQARSKGGLKDVDQIDSAVKLHNGKVVCTSCHDPNSRLPAKLVMSNVDSRLCQACHER